jgi:betaine/carnitine transporter, BCCT family
MATIPIAYTLHVKRSTTLRVSTACEEVLGDWVKGPLGKLLDILFIIGLVGGVGTSLGIGVPMLSAVASDLFGVERGTNLDIAILVGLTAVFAYSVSAGLDKGIKLLSDINVVLAIGFLAFVFLFGPTSFIVNQAFDSLALMFGNFVEMSLRTDAGNATNFAADNTVFFWAWWLSWAPFMGLFVARISGGRTIRQVIVGTVLGGSVACWVGFAILGHSTMALVNEGYAAMTALVTAAQASGTGVDAPQVVVELLGAQPFSVAVSAVFFVLSFIFVATSLDSAAFTLASAASEDLSPEGQPPRWHRLVWAFVLAGIAFTLMQAGGLQVLQAASVIAGLPLVAVMFVMMRSLTKALAARED